jgi:hypothetical protein
MSRKVSICGIHVGTILAIIVLVAAIAVPVSLTARRASLTRQRQDDLRLIKSAKRTRETSWAKECQLNLRMIETAKEQWAMDKSKSASDAPTAVELKPHLNGTHFALPRCPSGGTYAIGDMSVPPVCSVSANGAGSYDDHVLQ